MARVKLISAGMSELMRSSAMQRLMFDLLGPAEAQAKASAPRKTGASAASIHRESDIGRSRARGLLVADAPHALVVEANTGTLAGALDAVRGG